MPVWLVTGGTGFLGRHLLAALARQDVDVVTVGRKRPVDWRGEFVEVDFDCFECLRIRLGPYEPSVIVHLAGRTPPGTADDFYRGNTLATVHLLDAVRAWERRVRVVLVGSAAELGPVERDALPVAEDHPCRPVGGYGLSKLLATTAGLAARPPLEVVAARVFNPIGSGLPESQAFGRFAARLTSSEPGPLPIITGALAPRRDFIDARDVARALIALAERGRPGLLYHVGTGQSHAIGAGLEHLVRLSGRSVAIETDPRLARQPGPSDSRADIRRIIEHTGWRPEISWEQSLDDLWRDRSGDQMRLMKALVSRS